MLLRRSDESYEPLRRRILRETEAALHFGLLHPEQTPRIPTVIVGTARFHPAYAEQFWRDTLNLDADESVGFLKRMGSALRRLTNG